MENKNTEPESVGVAESEEFGFDLSLSRPMQKLAVPIEMIRSKKTAGAAFKLACEASCLEDKEIYIPLAIDPGYFSNIKNDKATLQSYLWKQFCDLVGNKVYPEWHAYQLGCTLVVIKSEAERRAEEAEIRLKASEDKVEMLTQILQGKGI